MGRWWLRHKFVYARKSARNQRHLSIAVPFAANDNDPMDARLARGSEILEGGFGSDGEDLLCGLEGDDAFEGGMAFLQ